jgi:hypothetical protein
VRHGYGLEYAARPIRLDYGGLAFWRGTARRGRAVGFPGVFSAPPLAYRRH